MVRLRARRAGTLKTHIRANLLGGMLILVPLGVTVLVLRLLFRWMSGFLEPFVRRAAVNLTTHQSVRTVPQVYVDVCIAITSLFLLLALLYVIGALGRGMVGRRAIGAWERLVLRIPFAGSIYGAAKQVVEAMSLQDRTAFKSAVFVEFPRPGYRAIGFLTGYIDGDNGGRYGTVFIPTTPNPTTGFLEIIPADEIIHTSLSIEEAFKMLISAGIIAPGSLDFRSGSFAIGAKSGSSRSSPAQ
jgi:uncharacterized membrane protein